MHVDRTRFLLLSATMATGACGRPAAARPPASGGDVEVAAPTIAITPEAAEPLVELSESEAQEPPPESFDEEEQIAAEIAQTCRSLRPPPGPHCESFDSTVEECEIYARALKPEAAARAAACVKSKSGTNALCDFSVSSQCFVAGTLAATPEPQSSAPCVAIMTNCNASGYRNPDLTMATCRTALGAVKDDRRPTLIACMTEGCGIGNCVYDLGSH